MQRRTTEKVEKENQSNFLRNTKMLTTNSKAAVKKENTKAPLTAEKATSSQRNVEKPVTDTKNVQVPKPTTTKETKAASSSIATANKGTKNSFSVRFSWTLSFQQQRHPQKITSRRNEPLNPHLVIQRQIVGHWVVSILVYHSAGVNSVMCTWQGKKRLVMLLRWRWCSKNRSPKMQWNTKFDAK